MSHRPWEGLAAAGLLLEERLPLTHSHPEKGPSPALCVVFPRTLCVCTVPHSPFSACGAPASLQAPPVARCVPYHVNGEESATRLLVSGVKTLTPSSSSHLWPKHGLLPSLPSRRPLPQAQACTWSRAHGKYTTAGCPGLLSRRDNVQRMRPRSFHGKPTGFGTEQACPTGRVGVGNPEPQLWAKSKPLPLRDFGKVSPWET